MLCGKESLLEGLCYLVGLPDFGTFTNKAAATPLGQIIKKVGTNFATWHWNGYRSLCADKAYCFCYTATEAQYCAADGVERFLDSLLDDDVIDRTGFRPVLFPMKEFRYFEEDKNRFGGAPDGTIRKMFTLLEDGKPVLPTIRANVEEYTGGELELTDEYYGEDYLIPWVICDGVAIASVNLLRGITWQDLHKQGFC